MTSDGRVLPDPDRAGTARAGLAHSLVNRNNG